MISYGYNRNVPRERMAVKRLNTPSHSVLLFEVTNAQADVTQYDEGASKGVTQFSPVGNGACFFLE